MDSIGWEFDRAEAWSSHEGMESRNNNTNNSNNFLSLINHMVFSRCPKDFFFKVH